MQAKFSNQKILPANKSEIINSPIGPQNFMVLTYINLKTWKKKTNCSLKKNFQKLENAVLTSTILRNIQKYCQNGPSISIKRRGNSGRPTSLQSEE